MYKYHDFIYLCFDSPRYYHIHVTSRFAPNVGYVSASSVDRYLRSQRDARDKNKFLLFEIFIPYDKCVFGKEFIFIMAKYIFLFIDMGIIHFPLSVIFMSACKVAHLLIVHLSILSLSQVDAKISFFFLAETC